MEKKKVNVTAIVAAIAVVIIIAIVSAIFGVSSSKNVDKLLAKGDKYMLALNYDKAIEMYEKVLELDEKSVAAYKGLTMAYVKTENYKKASKTLEKGIKKTEDSELQRMKEALEYAYNNSENWAELFESIVNGEITIPEEDDSNEHVVSESETEFIEEAEDEEESDYDSSHPFEHWKLVKESNTYGDFFEYEYNENAQLITRIYSSEYSHTKRLYEYFDNGILSKETGYTYYEEKDDNMQPTGKGDWYLFLQDTYDTYGNLVSEEYSDMMYFVLQRDLFYITYDNELNELNLPTVTTCDSDGYIWKIYREYDEHGNVTHYYEDNDGEIEDEEFYEYSLIGDEYLLTKKTYKAYDEEEVYEGDEYYIRGVYYTVVEEYQYDEYGREIKMLETYMENDGTANATETYYSYSPIDFTAGKAGDEFVVTCLVTTKYSDGDEYTHTEEYTYRYY